MYEAPQLVALGKVEDIVRGPGEMDQECSCNRYLFEPDDLYDLLSEE